MCNVDPGGLESEASPAPRQISGPQLSEAEVAGVEDDVIRGGNGADHKVDANGNIWNYVKWDAPQWKESWASVPGTKNHYVWTGKYETVEVGAWVQHTTEVISITGSAPKKEGAPWYWTGAKLLLDIWSPTGKLEWVKWGLQFSMSVYETGSLWQSGKDFTIQGVRRKAANALLSTGRQLLGLDYDFARPTNPKALPPGESPYQMSLFPLEPYDRPKHYGTPKFSQTPPGMEFEHDPAVSQHWLGGEGPGDLPGFRQTPQERKQWAKNPPNGRYESEGYQRKQGGTQSGAMKKFNRQWGLPKKK
jgi:hypothetical protein